MKDGFDHSDESLPARRPHVPPIAPSHPEHYQDDYADHSGHQPHGKRVSLKLLWKGLKRHGLIAFPIWLALSLGLMFLAFTKIKPTFDARSAIRIERGDAGVFTPNSGDRSREDFATYIQTQVSTISSPVVIETALEMTDGIGNLPMLANSKSPVVDIQQSLKVAIVPFTNLINVELSSQHPNETAKIVNAVVDSYLEHAKQSFSEDTLKRITELKVTRDEQKGKVERLRSEMGRILKEMGDTSRAMLADRNVKSIGDYQRYMDELASVNIRRVADQAKLAKLKADLDNSRGSDPSLINDEIQLEISADERVAHLENTIANLEGKHSRSSNIARSKSDPAVANHAKSLESARKNLAALQKQLEPSARARVMQRQGNHDLERQIQDLESSVTATLAQTTHLEELLDKVKIEDKDSQTKGLDLEFTRADMAGEQLLLERISGQVNELEFSQKSQIAHVVRAFPATPSLQPNSGKRVQAMILAPIATGFVIMLLLVFLELRGARVGDPDELASRMNLQVIGVVPPLPQLRPGAQTNAGAVDGAIMTNSEMKAQRQLDEFVQSLDHLRVALCARKDPWGRDKHCVLITSACGSEGKTTLAAQLAERCVNAGLMTLLIDADLRNPTLSRMLDAVDSPGLINVLRGEVLAEDVVTVIGDAGGFHLLPAGTPKMDPSRLLQSDRLGKLLAQARESFDMIIVDAPPVLPVPDALTIGKWTDGAVLAVRYDTSRFPLVERANRRLAHVGVPVIGAVVNGVRSMESAYGGYYAYGGYGSNAPTGTAAASEE